MSRISRRTNVRSLGAASPTATPMETAFTNMSAARDERLAQRAPVGAVRTWVLVVFGAATLVLVGAFPAGRSTTLRWLLSATSAVIVVGVLASVVLLVSPSNSVEQRRGPAEDFLRSLSSGP